MTNFYSLAKKSFFLMLLGFALTQCKKEKTDVVDEVVETTVSGAATILVEESVFPVVEDVNRVFESEYDRAKITLTKKSEAEILKSIFEAGAQIAVLPRTLDQEELARFEGKVTPKITHFASDAVVFVVNKNHKDSLIDYKQALLTLQDKKSDKDLMLVFDNVNSSVVRQFKTDAGITEFPKENVYFLPTTQEVIEYVEKNPNAVGVIGLNWLLQPTPELKSHVDQIKVLAVKNPKDGKFYKPSQNNIAEGTYPIIRKLYVLDFQGKSGLGTGFAAYIAGYKGQRIILKSGLVPFKVPPREVIVSDKNLE
ncbi:PstS family phosphate ABC transporter substrate-binding protein [Flavobacterium sp. HSC-61S13]|uniref:PstS family phosphate ABC transporter substrate-binding protein n=1 Tax=Flavobacterium sp. HSC-61S13 TaxID=2910963 RepID=UPI00209D799B|nr:substrate-binding domain-containing protein [Flavobacterium sp. HSC-61S13]MCP1996943.1 phosphate transport system substrate-binding protein [Flavobacterium sp. HSC-61S13]